MPRALTAHSIPPRPLVDLTLLYTVQFDNKTKKNRAEDTEAYILRVRLRYIGCSNIAGDATCLATTLQALIPASSRRLIVYVDFPRRATKFDRSIWGIAVLW